jgi:ABC-2 type transport system ATP-binding protein
MADLAISSSGLTKRFRGGQVAVDHVDLGVPHGSVFAWARFSSADVTS